MVVKNMQTNLKDRIIELMDNKRIDFNRKDATQFMKYEGSIGDAYAKIMAALHDPSTDDSAINLFLYGVRVLAGIIDYNLANKKDVLSKKHNIEGALIDVYSGNYGKAKERLDQLTLTQSELAAPLNEGIPEPDNISWAACNPYLVEELNYQLEESEVGIDFVVMDGHDAYRPGLMVAAAFEAQVCAIRNGIDSGRDEKPMLLKGEAEYLNDALAGKNVLVFGEDVSTGKATQSLLNLVRKVSDPGSINVACSIWISPSSIRQPDFYGKEKTSFD